MIRSHFARGVSEQGDMQKGSFQRWCKESRTNRQLNSQNDKLTVNFLII